MNPKQRSRGRGNNGGNPNRSNYSGGGGHSGAPRHINVRTQVFDSNGPEGRIRGNAHQVMEKYLALARDASSQGDRVAAENFYQHAEHYFRLINAYNQNNGQRRPQNLPTPAEDQGDLGMDDEDQPGAGPSAEAMAEAMAEDASGSDPAAEENEAPAERPQRAPRAPRAPRAERSEAPAESEDAPAVAADKPEGEARPERAPRRRAPRQAAQPAAEPAETPAAEAVNG